MIGNNLSYNNIKIGDIKQCKKYSVPNYVTQQDTQLNVTSL